MIPPKAAIESDAIKEAKLRAQQLHADFEAVFGQPGKRTSAQQNVFEHLAERAGTRGNTFWFGQHKDGIELLISGIQKTGAALIIEIIERQLFLAANAAKPKKEKPAVKRK